MTYRTFCTSHQLLDELIERYLMPEPEELSGEEFKDWEVKKQRPVRARCVFCGGPGLCASATCD